MKAEWATMKSENKLGSEYESYVRTYLTSHGYSIKRTYDIGYVSDPQTWDALATSNSEDSEAIINTYDSLLEYDSLNNLRPALAQSYDVSEDGLTYTFHLREGLTWVDSQGRKVADLKAEDFVAGFQHMLDAEGGLEFLVQGVVKNATEYCNGTATIEEVGVKATDDHTVVYTLTGPKPYFLTMLGYNIFAPIAEVFMNPRAVSSAQTSMRRRKVIPMVRHKTISLIAVLTELRPTQQRMKSCSLRTKAIGTKTASMLTRSHGTTTMVLLQQKHTMMLCPA